MKIMKMKIKERPARKKVYALLSAWVLLWLPGQALLAQKEANNWFFGFNAGITWNTTRTVSVTRVDGSGRPSPVSLEGLPTGLSGGKIHHYEGCFTISDGEGNLLLYSNGMTIWNRNHGVMVTGLNGHNSSAQSGIAMPNPGHPGQYMAVSLGEFLANNLSYTMVDMSLNDGLGGVANDLNGVAIKNILFKGAQGKTGETVSSIAHANGKDFWVVAPGRGATTYFNAWLVTRDGVADAPVVTTSPVPINTSQTCGYLKFSPDKKYFALPTYDLRQVLFGEFDAATGRFSNIKSISYSTAHGYGYGVEFSPSGDILYVSEGDAQGSQKNYLSVYKFKDLLAAADPNTVSSKSYPIGNGALQLGPDGRIYLVEKSTTYLYVVDNPEEYDNLNIYRLPDNSLGGGICIYGLPSFSAHWFATSSLTGNDSFCAGSLQAFSISITKGTAANAIEYIRWDFGDNSPIQEVHVAADGTITREHTYKKRGGYTITVKAYRSDSTEITSLEQQFSVKVNTCFLPVNSHIRARYAG